MVTQVLADGTSAPRGRARVLRLGLYLALLGLLASVVVAQRVSAELSERTLSLGRSLDGFQQLSGRVTHVSLNGQELALSTVVIEQPLEQVLAHFVSLCDESTGSVARELSAALGAGGAAASLLQRALVMRDVFDDGTGAAVCLAGLGAGGLRGLVERARSFARSWDVRELGQLRYAHLRTTGSGHTQLLLVTGDGPLRLDRLVPMEGRDVEGEDIIPGVRPAQSTRILAALARGTPHGLTAYRSRLSREAVLVDYGKQLVDKGYTRAATLVKAGEVAAQSQPRHSLVEAYRRGAEAFVLASRSDGEGSTLSVVKLADQPIPAALGAADVGRELVGRGRLGAPRDHAFE